MSITNPANAKGNVPFYPSRWLQAFTVDSIRSQISIGQAANPINKIFDKFYDAIRADKNKMNPDKEDVLLTHETIACQNIIALS